MSSPLETYDVFVSYAHSDASRVEPLVAALRARDVRVWFDRSNIENFDSITRAITMGLASAKALLAFYSALYPKRRACQWELTAAFVAAHHEGDPRRRVWVINPEDGVGHIDPIELRDELFMRLPPADESALEAAAETVANAASKLSTCFGNMRPLTQPRWYGGKGLGSNRFVGRTQEFWRLHSALFASDAAVVTGQAAAGHAQVRAMGGVGKSLFVEEYALRFGAAYPGGVFWIKGTEELEDQLYDCAARMGVAVDGRDALQIEGALERELRRIDKVFLWIVDDLPGGLSEADRRRWFAPNALGKTVISTRSREYGSTGGIIDLAVLEARDAYDLLTARRRPAGAEEQRAAEALVAELGGHALAIDVAGGALAKLQGWSFERFLNKIRATDHDALDAAASELSPDLPNGHDRSIARTLALSIDLVGDAGRDVLLLASVLASDVIPLELLDAVLEPLGKNSSWGAAALIDPVVNNCLADFAKQSNGQPGYRVHTLVRRTIRLQADAVEPMQRIRQLVVRALLKILPAVADIRTHASLSGHLPHARHLVVALSTPEEAALGLWVARHDLERGAFASARTQNEDVVETLRRLLGDGHSDTFAARLNLAAALYAEGDFTGARFHQEAALAALRQALGDEHPDTLTARSNLAVTLEAQGDLAGARRHQEDVLEARRRLLGAEHLDTLTARLNLAATLDAQGDFTGARDHEEAVVKALRGRMGDEHPNTLKARHNLAQTLKELGDLQGARGHEEAVLGTRRQVLGDEHPDTLKTRNNLAQTLKLQGDLAGARGHQDTVVKAMRQVLGDEHPDTLTAQNNLATTLLEQGDWATARSQLDTLLETARRVLGDEHPDTLRTQLNFARALKAGGNIPRAYGMQEAVLEARRRLLGDEHPATLTARLDLAATLYDSKDFAAARIHQEEVAQAFLRALGEEHPNTLTARINLAATLCAQGELAPARALQEAVLAACRTVHGDEHPDTLAARNNLAQTLHVQEDFDAALGHQEAVLQLMRTVRGDEHPDTIEARNNLASTLYAKGELERARGHAGVVFEARRRRLGDEHPATLTAKRNLALTLKAQGRVTGERDADKGATKDVAASAERVKVGRNQQCPCGSGKKYKRCCGGPSRGR